MKKLLATWKRMEDIFSGLGGRSVVVVGQADETLAVYYFCKIKQIQFWSIFRLKPGRCQT